MDFKVITGRITYGLGGLGQDLVSSLASAIQRFEGWGPGTVSQRNNNPGNLRSGPGMIGTDASGYAIFPDYQTGWNALLNQVQLNVNRGLTLDEFFAGKPGVYPGYAPAADSNQPLQYASTVGGWIGIDPTVPLNQATTSSVAASGGSGPLVDLSGSSAATPTSSILDQLQSSMASAGIDLTSPTTDVLLAVGLGVAGVILAKVL